MRAVSWNPEILIARREGMQSSLADVIAVAKHNRGLRIRMERSEGTPVLGSAGCMPASKAQFREGCVKAVELGMQPLPQKTRVLSEIHRRLDGVMESNGGSEPWQMSLLPILDFAGAWALAARLMQAGLSVLVREEEEDDSSIEIGLAKGSADVELVIQTDSTCQRT